MTYLESLESTGLTLGESKIYLALLQTGNSSAGRILEKATIQNSAFHFCINRLIQKGLVSYYKKGKTKVYSAVDPCVLLNGFKEKEKKFQEIIPRLRAMRKESTNQLTAEVFEGLPGVSALLQVLIEGAKKGDDFLFFSANVDEKNKEIASFYHKFDATRRALGLNSKGISPISLKTSYAKRPLNEIRYTKHPIPQSIAICNHKMALVSWDDTPSGVLISAQNTVDKQKEYFYQLWEECLEK